MDNNETNRPVCSCCGATIETDDYYTFDGNILCDECYHSETVVCEHCGDRIWADDNAGSDSMPLCNSCYDDYYTTCECCGRIIHRDCANYDDDDDYAYCETHDTGDDRYDDVAHVCWCVLLFTNFGRRHKTKTIPQLCGAVSQ